MGIMTTGAGSGIVDPSGACGAGFVANNLDCDDSDFNINPGATEIPGDGIDQDCDGSDLVLTCCTGIVGDANLSGDPATVGDISAIVNQLFGNGTLVACLDEADANVSGGRPAIPADITVGDIAAIVDLLFGSGTSIPCP